MPEESSAKAARGEESGRGAGDTERALRERVKELTCLYGISLEVARSERSLDERLCAIAAHLPPAWQFAESARARIVFDGREFCTGNWCPAGPAQTAAIVVDGVERGSVEVAYDREIGTGQHGTFLAEERELIDAVARKVALLVERVEAEQERERLRAQLLHADRLATVGRMSAGLAHELNEPLGSILGFAQLVARERDLPPSAARDVDRIVKAALHAREIVRRLMLFVRPGSTRRERVDLPRLVADTLDSFAARAARRGVEVALDSPTGGLQLVADPSQLTQVIVNLVVNALHSMPDGGKLTLQTSCLGDDAVLRVTDTGVGMAPRVLEQVFEPFFTTRDVGEGTGLGLSVVHGIVQAHGGRVTVASEPGAGTVFTVRLPRDGATEAEERR